MANKGTKIKLDGQRTEALHELYKNMILQYEVGNDHELLLLAHMKEFCHRLKVMTVREYAHYTISFSEPEMIAFVGCWKDVAFHENPWEGIIVKSIMDNINKRFHEIKTIAWRP